MLSRVMCDHTMHICCIIDTATLQQMMNSEQNKAFCKFVCSFILNHDIENDLYRGRTWKSVAEKKSGAED